VRTDRIRRAPLVAALIAVAALLALGASAAAATPPTLGVDLGASTGPVLGGASGSLYGLYDDGVPSDNLIQGMGLKTTDTKAQDGQQHPGSDALEIASPFLSSGGQDIYVYMTDVYRNFPYERTSYAQYQGYMRTEIKQVVASPYARHIVLVPYNEPDGNWFAGLQSDAATLSAFEGEWLQTYRFIKGLWPQARIAGPNFFQYQPGAIQSFMTFCKQNGCLPDIVTWHELNNASTVDPDVATFRALETSLGLGHRPINLDEYAARYQLTSPGRMVSWLSALENAKVFGDLAYWNINGTLGDSVSQNNIPNAQWWLYNWYSSLTGHTVQVTPPQPGADNTLQGVATLDPAKRQARIIVGGGTSPQFNVDVHHVSPAIFGRRVHATVEADRWSGMTGAAAAPDRVFDGDVPVRADGSVSLPVTNPVPPPAAGCDATGPRVPGKIGNALKLCGDDEYVSLPDGIVSGLHDFTVSAWVNPASNDPWARVFDFGTGTNDYMFLTLNAGGAPIRFSITTNGGGGAEQQINGTGELPTNAWSLVTVTLSGTTGTLYVNGQVVGTNTNMTLTPSDLGATTNNWIGQSQYPADPHLNATVDDFNIYSHALSASEVAALAGGQPGAGDVLDYKFDESGGATATDSSGHGHDGTIISQATPQSMDAYQIILAPGGTGSPTPTDTTWTQSYGAAQATMTGTGWNINTEGTPGNLGGFATWGDQDVGGLRTGSSTVITFHVDVPRTGDYNLRVFDGSDCQAADVSGPTNVFARVDGGAPQEVWLPCAYEWVIWNYGQTTVHLTAGAHQISLSTVGAGTQATTGDAIVDKIDLQLLEPQVQRSTVYEAEQADLQGAVTDYSARGQSGAGAADLARHQSVTFWVSAASDGYAELAFRSRGAGAASVTVNGERLGGPLPGTPAPRITRYRAYLPAGVSKMTVGGLAGRLALDDLTVTPVPAAGRSTSARVATYQAEDGTLSGTAHVDTSHNQAHGGVVTGISDGSANALTLSVHAPASGRYAMTVRYANDQMIISNHYNPDLMTAPADISINGAPTFQVNFASTFDWDQFSTLTIPVTLKAGTNTIRFIANPQYNWDGHTVGTIFSGSDVGQPLRSDTAPNLDEVTVAPLQLAGPAGRLRSGR
jgi:hypothetical protein